MQRAIAVGKRFFTEFSEKDLPELAAGLAYRFLFAIFPFGLFVAALTSYIAQWLGWTDPAQQILAALGDNLPADIAEGLRPELERLFGEARPGLVSIGAIGALWAATGGTMSIIKGTNRAFEVDLDRRGFFHKLGLALGLTLLAVVGVLASFVTIVGGSFITDQLADRLGLATVWPTISLIRWPIVFVALSLAVAVLYKAAPDIHVPWRWTIAGGVIFTTGWLIVTAGFGWYVTNLANFGATYGALGGVIVVMLWFYLTGLLLVAAAQLIGVLMAEVDPDWREARSSGALTLDPELAKEPPSAKPTSASPSPARAVAEPESPTSEAAQEWAPSEAPRRLPLARPARRASALFAGVVAAAGLAIGALLARLAGVAEDDA